MSAAGCVRMTSSMTALLVQRPAFSETFTRAAARILGTLAGAWLGSLLIAYLSPGPVVLAIVAALFALLAFATNSVNYGLFAACLTGYIVFLLALNQMPGPVIAHRRAWCTALGGAIAVLVHLDALLRIRFRRPDSVDDLRRPAVHPRCSLRC